MCGHLKTYFLNDGNNPQNKLSEKYIPCSIILFDEFRITDNGLPGLSSYN